MFDLIKKIWAGPFPVKVSLGFLVFVVFCIVLTNPGPILVFLGILYAIYKIIHWLEYGE